MVLSPPPLIGLLCTPRRWDLPGIPPWDRGRAERESASPCPASWGSRGAC